MHKKQMVRTILAFFVVFCFLTAIKADSTPVPDGAAGIEGVITVSPIQGGPTREGAPNSKPLPNTDFVVQNEKGVVTTFTTDDQGTFRVSLPAGHYAVSKKGEKAGIGRFGPFDVDVAPGKMTKVRWDCDTGIR